MNKSPDVIHLTQIFALLRPSCADKGKTAIYKKTALCLSAVSAKNPPWTWRYIQGIEKGTITPSPRITEAAKIFLERSNKKPGSSPIPIKEKDEIVLVHAAAGTVKTGAWILSGSRPCANPFCTIHFLPRVPWQKYCPPCAKHSHNSPLNH